jgi:hypothetical protein
MPAERRTPSDRELERYLERGFTHREIAEDWNRRSNFDVKPKSISAAISRAGLATERARHSRTLPWRVRDVPGFRHSRRREAQLLRALGRRMNGEELKDPKLARKLDVWLQHLDRTGSVVAYAPWDARGFRLVDRSTVPPVILDPEVPIVIEEVPRGGWRTKPVPRTRRGLKVS